MKLWLWSWVRLAWVWLKWFLLSPIRWQVLRDTKGLKARYGERPPTKAIFRLYHPAYWVLFWTLMNVGRRAYYGGRWFRWLVWCGGGFVETLLTGRVPGEED